ncbi:MAG: hypothetical protein K6F85_02805 [Bacteroidales bacterium]|nr:hypothetical protein [Bacteroidales bacterium]
MAKITKIANLQNNSYDWKFSTVGGVTRVNIETGEDLEHLGELDQKLWTVLSCPVAGLEFDEKTLRLMDSDHDGRIRVNEVVAASKWLCKVMRDPELIVEGFSRVNFSDINSDNDEGKAVLEAAKTILARIGKEKESIDLDDVAEYMTVFEEKCRAERAAAEKEADPYEPPYGDKTEDALAAVNALKDKIADFFMRCKLIQFDDECSGVLDVSVERVGAISAGNMAANAAEIATYPLSRPTKNAVLPVNEGINPAWQAAFANLKTLVLDVDFAGRESIAEDDWNAVLAKLDEYVAWRDDKNAAEEKIIADALAVEAAAIEPVDRIVRYCRDFFKFVHNFVVFKDFYSRKPGTEAIFQAGQLYIDQRCCDLCVKVTDMGKQAAMAGLSGMYLIYCHCVSKVTGKEMDIVAALTDGDVDNMREGKNAVFYDRSGQDWDATVTKIIDNPISVRQAFWSPYRKFGNWVTDKITKSASEKESKQFDEMTSKADTATTNIAAKADGAEAAEAKAAEKKAQMFDIAKFAGIFAAIGLAIGAIGGALAALGGFVAAKWYNVILLVAAVIILISGPSMLLAWLKLRKRNLGPVLNANGWAINSKIKINTAFGASLTSMAQYPKLVANDPFADKKTPWWKKVLWWLLVAVVVAFFVLLFTHNLPWQKAKAEPEPEPVEVVEEAPVEPAVEEAVEVVEAE